MRIWSGLGIVIDSSASDPPDLAKINSGAELADSCWPTRESLSLRHSIESNGIEWQMAKCHLRDRHCSINIL